MESFTREFERLSPSSLGEKIDIPLGWFVVSPRLVPTKAERRERHGVLCKITSEHSSIFRVLRFSANLRSAKNGSAQIILDYIGWLQIIGRDEDLDQTIRLTIQSAQWYEYLRFALSHPDLAYRLASWISLLSLGLGVLSIGLAVWGLEK